MAVVGNKIDDRDLIINEGDVFTVEKFLYESGSSYVYIRRHSDDELLCLDVYSMCADDAMIEGDYEDDSDIYLYSDPEPVFYYINESFKLA